MGVLNQLDQISAQYLGIWSPTIASVGMSLFASLSVISLIWFAGMQGMAVASGRSFNMEAFVEFFALLIGVFALEVGYASPIFWGTSVHGFVIDSTTWLAAQIGWEGANRIHALLNNGSRDSGSMIVKAAMNFFYAWAAYSIMAIVWLLQVVVDITVAAGNLGAALMGMFGPIFIPLLLFRSFRSWCTAWFRAFFGLAFYKVMAAAVLNIVATLLTTYADQMFPITPTNMFIKLPNLIELCVLSMFMCLAVPVLTGILFSGHTGGHGSVASIAAVVASRV